MGRAARHFAAAALERRPQQRVSRARTWMMPLNVEATSVKLEMPPPTMSARPRPSAPAVATSSIVLAYAYVSCAAATPSVAPPAICDPAAVWRHADVAEPLRRRRLPVRESDSFQAHVAPSSQAPHECLLGSRRTAVRQKSSSMGTRGCPAERAGGSLANTTVAGGYARILQGPRRRGAPPRVRTCGLGAPLYSA